MGGQSLWEALHETGGAVNAATEGDTFKGRWGGAVNAATGGDTLRGRWGGALIADVEDAKGTSGGGAVAHHALDASLADAVATHVHIETVVTHLTSGNAIAA